MRGAPQGEPAGTTGKSASLSKDLPTGSVTFLFTDIQGSTSMWERDAARMQQALVRHDEILRTIVTEHGGHVFKMVGDACYAVFSTAPEALRAAVAAQKAIFKEPWDERSRVRIRMALHTGEAEERDGDYFGPPLNRVARLLSAGHGGQTLISKATKELVEEHLPQEVSLRDMGERRLKDLKEPERIFQLLAPELPAEFPPLKTLETSSNEDRYRLIEKIGSGGMAEVYLAYDEFLQREVAFKVLDRKYAENKEAIERFRREARNAASLRHPNIVATHDRGETENGTYYIVMEYLEGGTLEDLIEGADGPIPPREAAEIALEIADALTVAHENDVIHRDIKPQNILLSATGEAKVADFGIARAASATTMTQAGSILGTVHYISPEQALGEPATPQSDLYSLGVVLYEMLTGELPYEAETPVGVIMKHVSGITRSPRDADPEIPEEIDAVAGRLLSRNPEERYPDAATLAEDLRTVAEGLPEAEGARAAGVRAARSKRGTRSGTSGRKLGTGGGGVRAVPAGARGTSRQRFGVLLALALVLVSVGVIAFVALNREGQDTPGAQGAAAAKLEGKEIPEAGSFDPGTYKTDEFEPAFSFDLPDLGRMPEPWQVGLTEQPDFLALAPTEFAVPRDDPNGMPPQIQFVNPTKVYPNQDAELVSAPEDMAAWIREHPDLEIGGEKSVSVGNVPGTQFDISLASNAPADLPLFRVSSGNAIMLVNGNENRLVVLNDVAGEAVVILIDGTKEQLEEETQFEGVALEPFLPKAQEVLKTVEWQAAPASSTADGEPLAETQTEWAVGAKKTPDSNPPKPEVSLAPGKYVTDEFEPAFTFNIGKGWEDWENEQSDVFSILRFPSSMTFVNVQAVYDSSSRSIPAPSDLTAWFQRHPYLKISEPAPVTVGGVSGKQFDVVLGKEPPGDFFDSSPSSDCIVRGGDCVPALILDNGNTTVFYGSNEYRVTVLDDVAGETVAIVESIPPDGPDEDFFSLAQDLLDTVEWRAAPAFDNPAPADAPAQTLPTEGRIESASYRTDEFEPSFSFDLGDGWAKANGAELPDILSLALADTVDAQRPSLLNFYRPQAVFDPKDPGGGTLLPAPDSVEGWVELFQDNRHLKTSEPVPVKIGGVSGMRIDYTVSSVPEGRVDLPQWTQEGGIEISDQKGAVSRDIILKVGGETVLIGISADGDGNRKELLPKAQEVLDTVEWGS